MRIIEDDMGTVVAKMRALSSNNAIYYMYGHTAEVNGRLLMMTSSPTNQSKKYPLVFLRLDAPARVVGDIQHYSLNMGIITFTDKNLNAEQRQAQVFKTKLYPLYELFFEALKKSNLFMWSGNLKKPEHVKIDRYYWGKHLDNKNTENIFSDPLDCIEIVDLKINSRDKKC